MDLPTRRIRIDPCRSINGQDGIGHASDATAASHVLDVELHEELLASHAVPDGPFHRWKVKRLEKIMSRRIDLPTVGSTILFISMPLVPERTMRRERIVEQPLFHD